MSTLSAMRVADVSCLLHALNNPQCIYKDITVAPYVLQEALTLWFQRYGQVIANGPNGWSAADAIRFWREARKTLIELSERDNWTIVDRENVFDILEACCATGLSWGNAAITRNYMHQQVLTENGVLESSLHTSRSAQLWGACIDAGVNVDQCIAAQVLSKVKIIDEADYYKKLPELIQACAKHDGG